jgi:hypothetical protein
VTREDQLLWQCLAAWPQAPAQAPAADDAAFWQRALDGGAAVLVSEQVQAPPPQAAMWRRQQAASAMRSFGVMKELVALLEAAGIRTAPLKGPVLAARLYGRYTARPTSDVDLLLDAGALDAALALLARSGGQVVEDAATDWERAHHHHVGCTWRGLLVELHFLASTNFGVRWPSEPLLDRAPHGLVKGLDGLSVRLLQPQDELLFLAMHAAAHRLRRDVHLLDLRLHVAQHPPDWPALEAQARALGLWRSVGVALAAAGERAGLDLSAMPAGWRAASAQRLTWLPFDLHPGYSEDSQMRLRGYLADALLTDQASTAAQTFAARALRGTRRQLQKQFPRWAPASWAG